MAEYIDREAVMKELDKYGCSNGGALGHHSGAADVEPVKRGHWVWERRIKGGSRRYTGVKDMSGEERTVTVDERRETVVNYCSECGKRGDDTFFNYCPNCGAKMNEKDGDKK